MDQRHPSPPSSDLPAPSFGSQAAPVQSGARQSGWRIVGRVKGWMMVATVVVMTGVALFVAPMLAGVLREQGITATGVSALYLRAPWLVSVLSLPTLATCWPLVRGTEHAIRWMTITTLLALIPLGFFLFGAVGCIAQIYSAALDG